MGIRRPPGSVWECRRSSLTNVCEHIGRLGRLAEPCLRPMGEFQSYKTSLAVPSGRRVRLQTQRAQKYHYVSPIRRLLLLPLIPLTTVTGMSTTRTRQQSTPEQSATAIRPCLHGPGTHASVVRDIVERIEREGSARGSSDKWHRQCRGLEDIRGLDVAERQRDSTVLGRFTPSFIYYRRTSLTVHRASLMAES